MTAAEDSDLYVSVNGLPCSWARVTVGYVGPWQAEVRLSSDAALPARCVVRIGELSLTGSPVPELDGTYALQRTARIIGGAGGWGRDVPALGYHNDAGVKALLVAQDAARVVGETLGIFTPTKERIGPDYARQAGPASRALVDVVGGAAWWVDYAGVTQVGPRPSSAPDAATYTVLAYDPAERTATVTADDPSLITVGATLAEGLDEPGTVRELEIVAGGEDKLRIHVWLGGTGQASGRLAGLITAITETITSQRLFGVYRYRVVSQAADDRVDMQALDPDLPDLRAISPWPGIPGARAKITPGGEALVMFAGGDRAAPLVMGYAHYGASGYTPVSLTLGGDSGSPAARKGDTVKVTLPPGTLNGTFQGNPITGVITWNNATADGTVTSGSSVVFIAPTITAPAPLDGDAP